MTRRRRGYALVQMLVAMFLVSSTLVTLAWTLHALLRNERQVRDALAGERGLERFTAQLRSDAHLATSVRTEPGADDAELPLELLLMLPGQQQVQYRLRPHEAERSLLQGETAIHRETYALPGSPHGWQMLGDAPVGRIALELREPAAPTRHTVITPPIARVEVAVGIFQTLPLREIEP